MSVNSSYGFLVFTTTDDVDAYLDYLKANTHADVQEYLSTMGFSNSLGATLYDEEYATELVTEEQAINYIVNTHRIFQVQNVVMKPINEVNEEVKWEFFLTMVSSNLNFGSYENLKANYYDENTMNKFAAAQEQETSIFEKIQSTPRGYEDEEPTECPTAEVGRPIIGWGNWKCGKCDATGHKSCAKKHYFLFWVDDVKYEYIQCN